MEVGRANSLQSGGGWEADMQNLSLLKNMSTHNPRLADGVIGTDCGSEGTIDR
jgi:hypothetical protein